MAEVTEQFYCGFAGCDEEIAENEGACWDHRYKSPEVARRIRLWNLADRWQRSPESVVRECGWQLADALRG